MSNNTVNKNEMGVNELISTIRSGLTQKSASARDENLVMQAMLNDRDFNMTYYSNDGSTSEHCPADEIRKMTSNIVAATTHISQAEAEALVNDYKFKKSDADIMIGLSKDFINNALRTGRKINFGGTEKSNISIQLKEVPESTKRYPKPAGVNEDGSIRYEKSATITIPAHEGLKVTSPCPPWVKV